MSYVSLARKYRPRRFVDMVGQESTTLALTNAIRLRREPHSVIFTGVRGVGKTTSARIYAKALNCENGPTADPCDVCASCLAITSGNHEDVLEIDGASNTGVDDVRALQETLSYVPQRSTYKIYIIDEVHMLSISAFNALLKTLEEPPQHVVFIFATTELHKVPETIQSRCQTFHLQKISRPVIGDRVRSILTAEGIPFDEAALAIVAREGRGSMRDALTMLDQAIAVGGGQVSLDALKNMVGSSSQALPVLELLDGLLRKDAAQILEVIARWDQEGLAMSTLVEETAKACRNAFILRDLRGQAIDLQLLELEDREQQMLLELGEKAAPMDLNRLFRQLAKCLDDLRHADLDRFILENYCLEWCFDPGLPDLQTLMTIISSGQPLPPMQARPATPQAAPAGEGPAINLRERWKTSSPNTAAPSARPAAAQPAAPQPGPAPGAKPVAPIGKTPAPQASLERPLPPTSGPAALHHAAAQPMAMAQNGGLPSSLVQKLAMAQAAHSSADPMSARATQPAAKTGVLSDLKPASAPQPLAKLDALHDTENLHSASVPVQNSQKPNELHAKPAPAQSPAQSDALSSKPTGLHAEPAPAQSPAQSDALSSKPTGLHAEPAPAQSPAQSDALSSKPTGLHAEPAPAQSPAQSDALSSKPIGLHAEPAPAQSSNKADELHKALSAQPIEPHAGHAPAPALSSTKLDLARGVENALDPSIQAQRDVSHVDPASSSSQDAKNAQPLNQKSALPETQTSSASVEVLPGIAPTTDGLSKEPVPANIAASPSVTDPGAPEAPTTPQPAAPAKSLRSLLDSAAHNSAKGAPRAQPAPANVRPAAQLKPSPAAENKPVAPTRNGGSARPNGPALPPEPMPPFDLGDDDVPPWLLQEEASRQGAFAAPPDEPALSEPPKNEGFLKQMARRAASENPAPVAPPKVETPPPPVAAAPIDPIWPDNWRAFVDEWKKQKPLQGRVLEEAYLLEYTPQRIRLAVEPSSMAGGKLLQQDVRKRLTEQFTQLFGFKGILEAVPKADAHPGKTGTAPDLGETLLDVKNREREVAREHLRARLEEHPMTREVISRFGGTIEQIELQ